MADGPRPRESLRREILAVLVLYGFLAVIPLIMGFACGRPNP